MKWVLRTSKIIVGTDEGNAVFRSVEECPPQVKRRLSETHSGRNACTILITNREALEAIRDRAIQAPPSVSGQAASSEELDSRPLLPKWQLATLILLALMSAVVGLLSWAMGSG